MSMHLPSMVNLFIHARIYKDLSGNVKLTAVKKNVSHADTWSIDYF